MRNSDRARRSGCTTRRPMLGAAVAILLGAALVACSATASGGSATGSASARSQLG